MSEMRPIRAGGSLLERAAAVYDFQAEFRSITTTAPAPASPAAVVDAAPLPLNLPIAAPDEAPGIAEMAPQRDAPPAPLPRRHDGVIDRALLAAQGLLIPGAAIGVLAEEFRLVKRQLLLTARAVNAAEGDRSRTILVCSANPNEGKTYCSLNLALSMAAERETEVLLVDADFAKPDVMARLGLAEGPGLLDALANPAIDVEACIVRTNVPQLSLLPAGSKSNLDTELLASDRTPALLQQLLDADPRRIVIFDSPPALAASPAATLALHVGQIMMVVRADKTSEGDLREAVGLLDGCAHIQLVLNAVSYAPGGRRFGSYYGLEEPQ
ncbi:AAA family ATPase [Sphingomonas sp. 28-63-12]|uniref:AAA family ATPase n=1 Tax=Sphingomonas sp. 28-63-12 TaxID=1970434 RepID=UPI000BD1795E|nr:MAG: exopolysaccharide biosynthesis protein [Sphingomonas sp. 28-63-12]